MKRFLSLLVIVLLALNIFLSLEIQQLNSKVKDLSGSQSTHIVETKVTQFTTDVTEIVDKSLEKVVGVHSYRFNNLYSTGSGAVYKVNDNVILIITNNHVINGADRVDIAFANGIEVTGEIMGSDLFTDLALIKVVVDFEVVPFKTGDSSLSKVGEWVLAIGSPLGNEFAGSVTMGILSGKDRVVPVDLDNNGVRLGYDRITNRCCYQSGEQWWSFNQLSRRTYWHQFNENCFRIGRRHGICHSCQ
jgi:serine protease Do